MNHQHRTVFSIGTRLALLGGFATALSACSSDDGGGASGGAPGAGFGGSVIAAGAMAAGSGGLPSNAGGAPSSAGQGVGGVAGAIAGASGAPAAGESSGGGGTGGTAAGGAAGGAAGTAGAAGEVAGSGGTVAGGGVSSGGAGGVSSGGALGGSIGGGTGGSAGAPGNLKSAMVVRTGGMPTAGDNVMIGLIRTRGFTVSVFADNTVQAADVAAMNLVVISSSAESAPLGTRLRDVAVPMLCVENGQYRNQGMTGSTRGTHWDETTGQTGVAIVPGAAELVGTLTGNVTISSVAGPLGWGVPGPAALIGATVAGNANQAAVFGYAKGAQMVGMVAPARRAGFAIREALAANLNADGKKLFDSTLAWVLQ